MRRFGPLLLVALAPALPLALVACTGTKPPKIGPSAASSASASAASSASANGPGDRAGGKSLRDDDDGIHRAKKGLPPPPAKPPPRIGLSGGLEALEASEYDSAERELKKAASNAGEKGRALVGLARVELATGRYADAIKTADQAASADKKERGNAMWVKGQALARQGKLDEAERALRTVENEPEARRARLFLGEVLIRRGKRSAAEAPLMTLIADFNQKRIRESDGPGMFLVGRAAHLLRSKKEANEAFDDAKRSGLKSPELFLARAALFIEAYNLGRAEEMTRKALEAAPLLPEAHVMMAEVKLDQTLDFDLAEEALGRALSVNKQLPEAYFFRAGIALRDMELERADKLLDEGLAIDPKHLELLSMRATVRFLADDKPGFDKAVKAVLAENGEYAKVYQIIADFADWEHRYAEIVKMMQEATKLDPDDGKSFVTLGLNQIRVGDDDGGVKSLDAGFRKDKFNVRAFNTLNLFEKTIPQQYESATHGVFRIRYPKDEKKVLERYVPKLLDEAWASMVKRYGFTPKTPVGVELYGKREHFAVRTSGLPNIGIQGVCFGNTLAAISPKPEHFNWGMVVWHEVGHVFAIQLSKAHVPRWFTEGLSEWETIIHRPEWQREEDTALYLALKTDRIPHVELMNRAFTHASDMSDMTVAYYASSQIAVFLADKYGQDKLNAMLVAWGAGKRTPEVIQQVLGVAPSELDNQFRAWVDQRLGRYAKQYVPNLRPVDPKEAEAAAKAAPNDPQKRLALALATLASGDYDAAEALLAEVQKLAPNSPDVRFLRAKMALRKKQPEEAKKQLTELIGLSADGYAVRMMLGDMALAEKDQTTATSEYEKAAAFDPSQAEPLQAIVDMAHKANDADRELTFLRKLALVDQHDRRVWRRLLRQLLDKKLYDEAAKVGEGALFVDIHGGDTHALYAEALLGKKDPDGAIFEAETVALTEKLTADVASRALTTMAKAYLVKGNIPAAKAARDEALRQDAENAEAKALVLP
jgi:cellulose synthase operon protein C